MTNWLEVQSLGIEQVLEVLPHRFPFLMIDKVLEIRPGKPLSMRMSPEEVAEARVGSMAKTLKNITYNEIQFLGHFPSVPIFPGVLTIEAMAQSAAFAVAPFLALQNKGVLPKLQTTLVGFDDVRFRKKIQPGDQMVMQVVAKQVRGAIWSFAGEAFVDGKRAAEAVFLAQVLSGGNA